VGRVIKLLYCDLCKRPVSRKGLRNLGIFQIPLCQKCYQKCVKDFKGGRLWP